MENPTRKPTRDEVMEYFQKRYAKSDIRVVPSHWPNFKTKAEVDKWFEIQNMMSAYADFLFKKRPQTRKSKW